MNERIFELARQSGATDENGSRATTVYCFTEQELKGFAELIVRECADYLDNFNKAIIGDVGIAGFSLKKHFGVE
jgi:hypothetical protein